MADPRIAQGPRDWTGDAISISLTTLQEVEKWLKLTLDEVRDMLRLRSITKPWSCGIANWKNFKKFGNKPIAGLNMGSYTILDSGRQRPRDRTNTLFSATSLKAQWLSLARDPPCGTTPPHRRICICTTLTKASKHERKYLLSEISRGQMSIMLRGILKTEAREVRYENERERRLSRRGIQQIIHCLLF